MKICFVKIMKINILQIKNKNLFIWTDTVKIDGENADFTAASLILYWAAVGTSWL